jgi:hypothetical protein
MIECDTLDASARDVGAAVWQETRIIHRNQQRVQGL